ncbi:uroporphyrinogen-III synthase [Haloarchaeobius iranensis]|uniref:Uroporphyrinogen-III synthase n=1 Tax=Haloarchaeobius iranensis TaxID=996166 RepID=A0A1G9VMG7_9EURY|nr:uroporphyrinogen-III synthase [Haloarchaeobius iranensis]SDM73448.1 uroporphyrinogen-III synthase [Haloarchaeobius iranensis]
MTTRDTTVAVFRPDDERLRDAVSLVESLGATPVPDPMLEVHETGASPRTDAEYTILTSKTGAELARETGWEPGETTVCAIGSATAEALRDQGYEVDLVPEEYSSTGMVELLAGRVEGARVEVARSDHGSEVLLAGLESAGAYQHETVLYELVRPEGAGESAELAASGDLDAACFTSSLTVQNFLTAAEERGVRTEAVSGLDDAVVGVIGEPTRETAETEGIAVDVVPEQAEFDELACAVVERAGPTYRD